MCLELQKREWEKSMKMSLNEIALYSEDERDEEVVQD
jgi:hypothetical protein